MKTAWLRHPLFWALLPALLGTVYALVHAWWSPARAFAAMAPRDTVFLERYRNVDVLDAWKRGPDLAPGLVKQRLGAGVNLPRLTGVDSRRPVSFFRLPAFGPLQRGVTLLPASDPDALADAHRRHGLGPNEVRHAQRLRTLGSWAAFSVDRGLLGALGEGGLTAPDEGEDLALAVDLPRACCPWCGSAPPGTRLARDPQRPPVSRWTRHGCGPPKATAPWRSSTRGTERVTALAETWHTAHDARVGRSPHIEGPGRDGPARARLLLSRRAPQRTTQPTSPPPAHCPCVRCRGPIW